MDESMLKSIYIFGISGTNIKFQGDKWLPTPNSYQIQSPIRILHADALVKELLNDDGKEWKTNLISFIFLEEEANSIQNIPTSKKGVENKLSWGSTKNGTFSIRSAYIVALHLNREAMDESSNGKVEDCKQKNIWNLNVLGKVRKFLWRASTNSFPTR